jgi:F-type H+-transporting ATPase subunit alpha
MTDAEHAVHESATSIPTDVRDRLDTADKLSDEDRKSIIEVARLALVPFQPKSEAKTEAKPDVESKPEVEAKPEVPTDVKSKPKVES